MQNIVSVQTQEARNEYYQKIRAIAKDSGVSILDFSDKEYEPYFLRDIMHLGKKGWVYMDEAVYRYHCNNEMQFEYPFESKLNVNRNGDRASIILTSHMSDVGSATLISKDSEIELLENDAGYLETRTELKELSDVQISVSGRYGAGTVLRPVIVERDNLFDPSTFSSGVVKEEDALNFSTDVQGNTFNLATFQLFNAETNEFIMNFGLSSSIGYHAGVYTHELENGIYKVAFKINSNRKDEVVTCDVRLEAGKNYSYEYELISLEQQNAKVGNIGFYEQVKD